eukprot:TRINITY_DN1109_c0_g1_i5.p1 TRINITY_DN1109_c0_g1~~TRINITY_DN1109_c0_g1_i5.p1  ORF type:complete len:172 (-),score=22.96 TRINITY_DN1109_c0_g1_i5:82-597(-)
MAIDLSAIAKWPNVPACYDWLSLDRRGDWRLQGERVTHSGLIQFINRQYGRDESGCWFLQNGPQRVFVALAYTPWIFRRETAGFVSHTGAPTGLLKAVYLDEGGYLLLDSELGIGLLDDRREKNDQKKKTGRQNRVSTCLLYTSDAADDMQCVDLGGRRIIKKKKKKKPEK